MGLTGVGMVGYSAEVIMRDNVGGLMDGEQNRGVAGGSGEPSVSDISGPLFQARRWIYFLGYFAAVGCCIVLPLLIVVIVVLGRWAWLLYCPLIAAGIWQGVLLISAARAATFAHTHNDGRALFIAMVRLRAWFKTSGWLLALALLFDLVLLLYIFGRGWIR